jgi:intracellular multiplication protein IcmD
VLRQIKLFKLFLWFILGLALPRVLYAQVAVMNAGGGTSVGTVASNLSSASTVFNGVLSAMFYIIGIALVTASIIKYRDYKQNASQTPVSKPIFLFLAGIILGFFPLIINHIDMAAAPYRV